MKVLSVRTTPERRMVQRRSTLPWVAGFGLIALGTAACSLLFATNEEQCSTDGDCQARGAKFAGSYCSAAKVCVPLVDSDASDLDAGADADNPFFCADNPSQAPDPSRQVELSLRFLDYSEGKAPKGGMARLCGASDPPCKNPRIPNEEPADAGEEAGSGWVYLNDAGAVTAQVELGFEGFYQFQGPGYPPNYRSTSPPLWRPVNKHDQVLLLTDEINYFADTALGKPGSYDSSNYGLVLIFVRDCNMKTLAGVTFSTSAESDALRLFYIINSSPSLTDTKTDPLGRAGFVNVPPGIHTFYAKWADTGKHLGSARLLVRAGAVTTIALEPSP